LSKPAAGIDLEIRNGFKISSIEKMGVELTTYHAPKRQKIWKMRDESFIPNYDGHTICEDGVAIMQIGNSLVGPEVVRDDPKENLMRMP
jgi:hypothetical protein